MTRALLLLALALGVAGPRAVAQLFPQVRVAQESAPGAGDFDANVVGFVSVFERQAETPEQIYDYDGLFTESYSGLLPATQSNASHLFLADTVDGLFLFAVHDQAGDGSGGETEMRFVLGRGETEIRVEDDPGGEESSDSYTSDGSEFTAQHEWSECCGDGMVIGPLRNWSMTVAFTDLDGQANDEFDGIDRWIALSSNALPLELFREPDRRVRLDIPSRPVSPPGEERKPPPAITFVQPDRGPEPGETEVRIEGEDFRSHATVAFGGASAASVSFLDSNTIVAVTPPGVGTVDVTLTNPSGASDSCPGCFTYEPPPSILSVAPDNGPAAGGSVVTILGDHFRDGLVVLFGGAEATDVALSGTFRITCTAPPGVGTVDVSVVNPDGQAGARANAFTYNPPPLISSVAPNVGVEEGGEAVTLAGQAFLPGPTVTFGDLPAQQVTVVDSGTVTALTPPGLGTVDVTLTNPDGQTAALAGAFTYQPAEQQGDFIEISQESAPGADDFDDHILGSVPIFDRQQSTVAQLYNYDASGQLSYNGTEVQPLSNTSQLFFIRTSQGLALFALHDQLFDGSGGDMEMVFDTTVRLTGRRLGATHRQSGS